MTWDDLDWCHDCDEPIVTRQAFYAHASAGHAITRGRCFGKCQFRAGHE